MAKGDTLVNAVLGAAVTIVATPFVPGAPVLGGILAGYLQGRGRREGLRVGLYAGLLALVPLLLLIGLFGGLFLSVVGAMGAPAHGFGGTHAFGSLGLVFVLFAVLSTLVYVVVLSTVGGWVGSYLQDETDL